MTHNFKGYTPYIVIIKYWLYSLCCTICPYILFIHNSLYLLIPTYLLSLPASLFPLVTNWFSIEDKRIYCDCDLVPCFIRKAFPSSSDGKESTCNAGNSGFDPWVWRIPWRRAGQPTPVFLPGKFYGKRILVGYSPWGCKESDRTEWLTLSLLLGIIIFLIKI